MISKPRIRFGDIFWEAERNYLHRDEDKPSYIGFDGTLEYYRHNKLHREDDKPAIIYPDGEKRFFKQDKGYFPEVKR